jgi:hypothetical protein
MKVIVRQPKEEPRAKARGCVWRGDVSGEGEAEEVPGRGESKFGWAGGWSGVGVGRGYKRVYGLCAKWVPS